MKTRYIFAIIATIVIIVGVINLSKDIAIEHVIATSVACMVVLSVLWLTMGNLTGSGTYSPPDMELDKGEVFKVVGFTYLDGAAFTLVTRYPFNAGDNHEKVLILRFKPEHLDNGPHLNIGYKYIWNGEKPVSIID